MLTKQQSNVQHLGLSETWAKIYQSVNLNGILRSGDCQLLSSPSQVEERIWGLVQRSTSQDENHVRSLTKQNASMANDVLATGQNLT